MKLKRYEDWPARLHKYVTDNSEEEFRYGWHDCALFLCGAINVMTGIDPAEEYRGVYSDKESAEEAINLKYANLKELAEDIAHHHGMPEIGKFFAQRGDAALLNTISGWTLGIVAMDGRSILVPAKTGYKVYDLKEAEKVWRV